MTTFLCSRKRVSKPGLTQRLIAVTSMFFLLLSNIGFGQSNEFYETDNYNPLLESKFGKLGTLFNAQPHLLLSVPTTLHGPQDVWTTAYLPFVDHEFDPSIPLTLFGPHYTTGIALCSPRDPALELYAPIQVRSIRQSANNPDNLDISALAKSSPPGQSPLTAGGPFNEMLYLNKQEPSFAGQQISYDGLTALGYAQQFARFSHEVLKDQNDVGWNGSDKKGKVPIRFSIIEGNISGFDVPQFVKNVDGKGEIIIPTPEYGIGIKHYTIAHEIGHAITFNVQGGDAFPNFSKDLREINEGFCDILGHSFRLWMRPEQFSVMDWELFREYVFPAAKDYLIDDPKLSKHPVAYLGEFYETDALSPGYDVHRNASVFEKWFSLIVDGGKGHVDDNVQRGAYWVKPLIPGDLSATYTLALRIVFQAFTKPMAVHTNYPLLRAYILAASQDLGYPPGTHVYEQISRAWAAVGVGQSNTITTCDQTYAESLLNGTVQFPAVKSIGQDPTEYAQTLSDCSQPDSISVLTATGIPFTDWDGDKIFSETNDEFESKVAVSIYNFGRLSRDFFKKNFNHGGYDVSFNLIDGNSEVSVVYTNDKVAFSIPMNNKQGVADRIARNYFAAVNRTAKNPLFPNMAYSEENAVWYTALANIFSLEIRREFEIATGNPEAESLWTTEQDYSDLQLINDFADPKKYGQPALYQGQFWEDGEGGNNAGIVHLFYYLLAHGTKADGGQDNGYTNVELPGKVYFVNAIDRRLVWKVLWNAFLSTSYQAGIEEFRQATFVALQQLDPVKYHTKSKEYIALYDAWAAVLGLSDYASNLKHYPSDGTPVYPWAAKVGVEVEYPLYESYRLFEVSKSSTFNEADAPVHRFVNTVSPDQQNLGMAYGDINLEGGQVYWVRSRSAEGEGSRQFCATTDDPHFCESLLNKNKWSLPFAITTATIQAPIAQSPSQGEQVRAWGNTFSFGQVWGARGYDLYITDPMLTAATHTVSFEDIYNDENPGAVIEHAVTLSAKKEYSYKIAGRQKLGSESAVHVLPGGMLQLMSEDEKEQFPDIYSDATDEIFFKTDQPTMILESPDDGVVVPLFGAPIVTQAKEEEPKRADYFVLFFREPLVQEGLTVPQRIFQGTNLPEWADGKEYKWTMAPVKAATPPFIPEDEVGKAPEWRHLTVSAEEVPAPVITSISTHCATAGKKVSVSWEPVLGAKGYEYAIIDMSTMQVVAKDIVTGLTASPPIAGATIFPRQYKQVVRAGIVDSNGDWVFGKAAEAIYNVRPEPPTNLTPSGQSVSLGENNSIHFAWEDPQSIGAFHFTLHEFISGTNSTSNVLDTDFSGTDILVEDLKFDTEYQVTVRTESTNGCNSPGLVHGFKTEEEPITMEPELNFKFQMLCTDVLGWGILDPFITYNLTVTDPNGNTVLNKPGLSSVLSIVDEKLPVVEGIYTATAIITEADPVYLKTEEEEASVVSFIELFNKVNNKKLDSDVLGAHFDPVQNLIIQLQFQMDMTNLTVSHRTVHSNEQAEVKIKMLGIEVRYPELALTVFPNPASNEIQIMPGLEVKGKPCPLQIVDQQGRTVISKNWQGEKLDVSGLAEGMYIVTVKRGALMFSQKLMIKK